MIILFNIRITSQRLSVYQRAYWLPKYDRVDVFKYTLASYKAFDSLISKAVFYIQLDPEYAHRQKELEDYILSLFPNCILRWERNFYAREWNLSYARDIADHPDDLIWVACNDDHVFVDYNLDVLTSGLNLLSADPNPYSVLLYSHWHEAMSITHHKQGVLSACGNWVSASWSETSAIQVIKKERLNHYFSSRDLGDIEMYRTDCLMSVGYELVAPIYAPTREVVMHYDAYSHVGCPANRAAPLVIPPGFFENQLRVRYGYYDRKEGWVNVNPAMEYYAVTPEGADVKTTFDRLPMFWQPVEIDINPDVDHAALNTSRAEHFVRQTHCPMYSWEVLYEDAPRIPPHWYQHHL